MHLSLTCGSVAPSVGVHTHPDNMFISRHC
jgi:hypothetical protein